MAETDHSGVQVEHFNKSETGLEQQNILVRDCPSLVGGRPAKSVVERPRGFKSHIPRHNNRFIFPIANAVYAPTSIF